VKTPCDIPSRDAGGREEHCGPCTVGHDVEKDTSRYLVAGVSLRRRVANVRMSATDISGPGTKMATANLAVSGENVSLMLEHELNRLAASMGPMIDPDILATRLAARRLDHCDVINKYMRSSQRECSDGPSRDIRVC